MIRLLLSLVTLTISSSTFAITPVDNFVPENWKIVKIGYNELEQISGDLNSDGKIDTVLVIEEDNPANWKENSGMGPERLNYNPRNLVFLLSTENGSYKTQNIANFLPTQHSENPCLGGITKSGVSKG